MAVPIAVAAGTYAMTQAMANDARNIRQHRSPWASDRCLPEVWHRRRRGVDTGVVKRGIAHFRQQIGEALAGNEGGAGDLPLPGHLARQVPGGDTGEIFERAAKSIDAMGGSISATARWGPSGRPVGCSIPSCTRLPTASMHRVSPLELHGLD